MLRSWPIIECEPAAAQDRKSFQIAFCHVGAMEQDLDLQDTYPEGR